MHEFTYPAQMFQKLVLKRVALLPAQSLFGCDTYCGNKPYLLRQKGFPEFRNFNRFEEFKDFTTHHSPRSTLL
jgi:hypothetical protein